MTVTKIPIHRKASFIVVHVGEPVKDKTFGDNKFREVKFIGKDGKILKSLLHDSRFKDLSDVLVDENAVEIDYDVELKSILTVNGLRWN